MSIQYCAGFLDGDGSFFASKRSRRPTISSTQVSRLPLDVLQVWLGGKVYGPYPARTPTRQPFYIYRVTGVKAQESARLLLPYLVLKVKEAEAIIEM